MWRRREALPQVQEAFGFKYIGRQKGLDPFIQLTNGKVTVDKTAPIEQATDIEAAVEAVAEGPWVGGNGAVDSEEDGVVPTGHVSERAETHQQKQEIDNNSTFDEADTAENQQNRSTSTDTSANRTYTDWPYRNISSFAGVNMKLWNQCELEPEWDGQTRDTASSSVDLEGAVASAATVEAFDEVGDTRATTRKADSNDAAEQPSAIEQTRRGAPSSANASAGKSQNDGKLGNNISVNVSVTSAPEPNGSTAPLEVAAPTESVEVNGAAVEVNGTVSLQPVIERSTHEQNAINQESQPALNEERKNLTGLVADPGAHTWRSSQTEGDKSSDVAQSNGRVPAPVPAPQIITETVLDETTNDPALGVEPNTTAVPLDGNADPQPLARPSNGIPNSAISTPSDFSEEHVAPQLAPPASVGGVALHASAQSVEQQLPIKPENLQATEPPSTTPQPVLDGPNSTIVDLNDSDPQAAQNDNDNDNDITTLQPDTDSSGDAKRPTRPVDASGSKGVDRRARAIAAAAERVKAAQQKAISKALVSMP